MLFLLKCHLTQLSARHSTLLADSGAGGGASHDVLMLMATILFGLNSRMLFFLATAAGTHRMTVTLPGDPELLLLMLVLLMLTQLLLFIYSCCFVVHPFNQTAHQFSSFLLELFFSSSTSEFLLFSLLQKVFSSGNNTGTHHNRSGNRAVSIHCRNARPLLLFSFSIVCRFIQPPPPPPQGNGKSQLKINTLCVSVCSTVHC